MMKKILIGAGLAIILLVLAGIYKFNYLTIQDGQMIDNGGIGAVVQKKHKIIKSISPQEFKNIADSGEYTIIDVRTPDEFKNEVLFADALNIDYYKPDFRENLAKLDPDESYLIYCRSGSRSGKTLKIMKDLGFKNVADLAGGRKAWLKTFPINIEPKVIESKKEDEIPAKKVEVPKEKICPEDVKICPDGATLGRKGLNCEFAKCPVAKLPEKPIPLVNEIPAKKGISLSEVAKHKSEYDCWTAINGKIYDVTAFFHHHPGGDRNLLRVCGIDATSAFNAQHKYQTSAKNKLEEFYIDDLRK